MSRESQKSKILRYLKSGKTLTRLTALRLFNCFELSARLIELTDDGETICAVSVTENGKHFNKYWMQP